MHGRLQDRPRGALHEPERPVWSRCLLEGDYGALRTRVLTEIGPDADLARKGANGGWKFTAWAPRGQLRTGISGIGGDPDRARPAPA